MTNKDDNSFIDYEKVKEDEKKLYRTIVGGRIGWPDKIYKPPLVVEIIYLFITVVLYCKQINETTTIIHIIPFIIAIISAIYTAIRFKLNGDFIINCLTIMITFITFFTSLLVNIDIRIPFITDIIFIILIIYIEIYIRKRTLKNICLEITNIESIDYEKEMIYLEEKRLNKIFVIKYDLGDKLKIGDKINIDKLCYYEYKNIEIEYKGKTIQAYTFININKDKLFKQ